MPLFGRKHVKEGRQHSPGYGAPARGLPRNFVKRKIQLREVGFGHNLSMLYGPRGREILCNLVLRGVLTIDLSLPISPNTRFAARKEDI
jgi:hypothetical protein